MPQKPKAPSKIATYNLGEPGVVLIKSPVHGQKGELAFAQNAAPNPEGGLSGIRKRLGMTTLNADAAAGALLAMINIPLVDPNPGPAGPTPIGAPTPPNVVPTLNPTTGTIWWFGPATPGDPFTFLQAFNDPDVLSTTITTTTPDGWTYYSTPTEIRRTDYSVPPVDELVATLPAGATSKQMAATLSDIYVLLATTEDVGSGAGATQILTLYRIPVASGTLVPVCDPMYPVGPSPEILVAGYADFGEMDTIGPVTLSVSGTMGVFLSGSRVAYGASYPGNPLDLAYSVVLLQAVNELDPWTERALISGVLGGYVYLLRGGLVASGDSLFMGVIRFTTSGLTVDTALVRWRPIEGVSNVIAWTLNVGNIGYYPLWANGNEVFVIQRYPYSGAQGHWFYSSDDESFADIGNSDTMAGVDVNEAYLSSPLDSSPMFFFTRNTLDSVVSVWKLQGGAVSVVTVI